jgi:hypothetical protein
MPIVKANTKMIRKNSALFWFTLAIPVGIIGIGVNFILNPSGASAGFGLPITDPASFPYMWIKGIRDIFSGLVILPFLLRGDRRVTAILFAIAIFVPFCDGLVILTTKGFSAPLLIHWGTAFYMLVVSYFLLRTGKNADGKTGKLINSSTLRRKRKGVIN